MGYGYLFSKTVLEPANARAVITFSAGPWAQMVAFKENDLKATRTQVREDFGASADLVDDLVYGLPPIPVPSSPKIVVPPPDSLVAIVLARVAPGSGRAFVNSLDPDTVTGAARLLAPYGHVLLDLTVGNEDLLSDALDAVLDRPEVLRAKVGIALAEDVAYLDRAG